MKKDWPKIWIFVLLFIPLSLSAAWFVISSMKRTWFVSYLEDGLRKELGADVRIQTLKYRIAPPSIHLEGFEATGSFEGCSVVIKSPNVLVKLSTWKMLQGELSLAAILPPESDIAVDCSHKREGKFRDRNFLFSNSRASPFRFKLEALEMQEGTLSILFKKEASAIGRKGNIKAVFLEEGVSLDAYFNAFDLLLEGSNLPFSHFELKGETRKNHVDIKRFQVKYEKSGVFLSGRGKILGSWPNIQLLLDSEMRKEKVQGNMKASFDIKEGLPTGKISFSHLPLFEATDWSWGKGGLEGEMNCKKISIEEPFTCSTNADWKEGGIVLSRESEVLLFEKARIAGDLFFKSSDMDLSFSLDLGDSKPLLIQGHIPYSKEPPLVFTLRWKELNLGLLKHVFGKKSEGRISLTGDISSKGEVLSSRLALGSTGIRVGEIAMGKLDGNITTEGSLFSLAFLLGDLNKRNPATDVFGGTLKITGDLEKEHLAGEGLFSIATKKMRGELSFQGRLKGFQAPRGQVEWRVDQVILEEGGEAPPSYGKITFADGKWKGNANLLGEELVFSGLVAQEDSDSRLEGKIKGKFPVKFTPLLWSEIEKGGGILDLSATLSGTLKFPHISGKIRMEDAFLAFAFFPHPLESIKSTLRFDDQGLVVESLQGYVGMGDMSIAGKVGWNGKPWKDFEVGEIHLHSSFKDAMIRFPTWLSSRISGKLRLDGPKAPYELSGEIFVDEALYAEPIQWKTAILKIKMASPPIIAGAKPDIAFNIDVKGGERLIVQNKLLEARLGGDFKIIGNSEVVNLIGALFLQEGTFRFRENRFTITSAIVRFENPYEIKPYFQVSAVTRIRRHKRVPSFHFPAEPTPALEYEVMLNLDGTPDDHRLHLVSQPPLAEVDIVSLLMHGLTRSEMAASEQLAAQYTVVEFGSLLLGGLEESLAEEARRALGIMVEVGPTYSVTQQAVVPRVSVSKEIGDRLYISHTSLFQTETLNTEKKFGVQYQLTDFMTLDGEINDATTVRKPSVSEAASFLDAGADLRFHFSFK